MRASPLLLLGALALPATAAPEPEKPGAALAALELPACDYKPGYWTPVMGLSAPLAKGDYAAVERELEDLHASFERNHACENRMIRAFLWGFREDAELLGHLDRWVAARPNAWTAYTIRGEMWMQKLWQARGGVYGKRLTDQDQQDMREATERALSDLERAIELHPSAMVAHAALVQVFQAWRDPGRVEAAYRRAIAIDPVSVHLLSTTLTAFEPQWGGRREQAEAIVAEARRHEAKNPRVARVYGYPDAWRAQALEWGKTIELVGPRSPLGDAERDAIIRWYSKALRYGEVDSEWHYRRAATYRDRRQYEHAVADADFALAAAQTSERWWGLKAWSLAELGRYDESLVVAREGLRHVPDSNKLRYYEADAFLRMARYDDAARLFQAAVAHAQRPHDRATNLRGLGLTFMRSKRYAEAEAALTGATAIEQWHALTWHSLGEARWKLGRREQAVPAYEQFLAKSEGKDWAEELRMRAQEKIDMVRFGSEAPASAPD